jgi:hypothetical protein
MGLKSKVIRGMTQAHTLTIVMIGVLWETRDDQGAQLCRAIGTAMAGVALGAVLPWSGTAHARQVTPVSLVQQCPRLASAAFARLMAPALCGS